MVRIDVALTPAKVLASHHIIMNISRLPVGFKNLRFATDDARRQCWWCCAAWIYHSWKRWSEPIKNAWRRKPIWEWVPCNHHNHNELRGVSYILSKFVTTTIIHIIVHSTAIIRYGMLQIIYV